MDDCGVERQGNTFFRREMNRCIADFSGFVDVELAFVSQVLDDREMSSCE